MADPIAGASSRPVTLPPHLDAVPGEPRAPPAASPHHTMPEHEPAPTLERATTSLWLTARRAGEAHSPASAAAQARGSASLPEPQSILPLSALRDEKTFGDVLKTFGYSAESALAERAFKLISSDPVYHRLAEQYTRGTGVTLSLSRSEVLAVGGIQKIDISRLEGFNDACIRGFREVRARGVETTVRMHAEKLVQAQTPLTLGNYTARFDGYVTVRPDGTWKFTGVVQAHDVWDFDAKPFEDEHGRTTAGEFKTRLGAMFLPGKPFVVTSEPIPVEQQKGEFAIHLVNTKD